MTEDEFYGHVAFTVFYDASGPRWSESETTRSLWIAAAKAARTAVYKDPVTELTLQFKRLYSENENLTHTESLRILAEYVLSQDKL